MKAPEYVCGNCGYYGWPTKVTRGSFAVEALLWLFFLVPGFIYTVWRLSTRQLACAVCLQPTMIPISSPRGWELMKQYGHLESLDRMQKAPPTGAADTIPEWLWSVRWAFLVGILIVAAAGGAVVLLEVHDAGQAPIQARERAGHLADLGAAALKQREADQSGRETVQEHNARMLAEVSEPEPVSEPSIAPAAGLDRQEEARRQAVRDTTEAMRRHDAQTDAQQRQQAVQAQQRADAARLQLAPWLARYKAAVAPMDDSARVLLAVVKGQRPVGEFAGACEALRRATAAPPAWGTSGQPQVDRAAQGVLDGFSRVAAQCSTGRQFETERALVDAAAAEAKLAAALQ